MHVALWRGQGFLASVLVFNGDDISEVVFASILGFFHSSHY